MNELIWLVFIIVHWGQLNIFSFQGLGFFYWPDGHVSPLLKPHNTNIYNQIYNYAWRWFFSWSNYIKCLLTKWQTASAVTISGWLLSVHEKYEAFKSDAIKMNQESRCSELTKDGDAPYFFPDNTSVWTINPHWSRQEESQVAESCSLFG